MTKPKPKAGNNLVYLLAYNKIGDIINLAGKSYLIVGLTGRDLSHLNSNVNVLEYEVQPIGKVMTMGEIKQHQAKINKS